MVSEASHDPSCGFGFFAAAEFVCKAQTVLARALGLGCAPVGLARFEFREFGLNGFFRLGGIESGIEFQILAFNGPSVSLEFARDGGGGDIESSCTLS